MPNRNMQAKFMKARTQAAAYALDCADRDTYHDTAGIKPRVTVVLEDIIEAYRAAKKADLDRKTEMVAKIRAGLSQTGERPGLAAKYRR
jgi:hypothetical protein